MHRAAIRSALRRPGWVLAVGAGYYLTGHLGLLLAIPPGFATAVWPPSGLALAAVLLFGAWVWPGVALGSFFLNVGTTFDGSTSQALVTSLSLAAGIGLGGAAQSLLGARLVRRALRGPLELLTARDVLVFLLLGGPASCLLNATWSVALLWCSGRLEAGQIPFTWWTWWMGDAIGVLVVTPLAMILAGKPREVWRRRGFPVALPLALLYACVVVLFVRVRDWEDGRMRHTFATQCDTVARELGEKLEDVVEALYAVERLFATFPEADWHAFRTFVQQPLARHPALRALSWNPVVRAEARDAFERLMQAEGLRGYEVRERMHRGGLVRADARRRYVPVAYIEPQRQNELAVGYDVASEPLRLDALERAARGEGPAVTERLALVQGSEREAGVLCFLAVRPAARAGAGPAPREAPAGFVTGVVQVERIATAAIMQASTPPFTFSLADPGAREGRQLLWESAPSGPTAAGLSLTRSIAFADRTWTLRVGATPAYVASVLSWRAWTVLAGGMIVAGLLGTVLLIGTGEAVAAERLTVQRESEVRQAQKMEAIGRLSGGIAHDFNNLLTAVIGHVEFALRRPGIPSAARADLETIRHAAERAAGLTRQLLAFGRKQILQPRVVDPAAFLADMDRLLRRVIGEHIELHTGAAPGTGRIKADVVQLQQVVMNLAINARDAMPQGGRLSIQAGPARVAEGSRPHAAGLAPGPHVVFEVRDSGHGMGPEVLAHVFEPFFTTKAVNRGTGLGLSTVYGIVSQSGGHIEVDSRLGGGTTFRILFPKTDESPSVAERAPALAPRPSGSPTLLLVEDEQLVRDLVRATLVKHGYTVLEAQHGGEALQILEKDGGAIRLVISDVVMPRMGGVELAQAVAGVRPGLKWLFISGYSESAIERHGAPVPQSEFMAKPFTPDDLIRKVHDLLSC